MKMIVHDLGESYNGILTDKCDELFCADGKYAPCQGCFGCWTKTPAECFMKDRLQQMCRLLGNADELVIITENCYGSYNPEVKNVFDRSIGVSTPFSTYRGKQMHHTLRYGINSQLTVIVYGDITADERGTIESLAVRNRINMGFEKSVVRYCESAEKVGEML